MLRYVKFLCVVIIFILGCSDSTSPNDEGQPETFTIMLYNAGDYQGLYNPMYEFASSIPSNAKVQTVILTDTYYDQGYYYRADSTGSTEVLEELGEINTGSKDTMLDFINYTKSNYKADKYILFISDHGGGWVGSCIDNNTMNESDLLDSVELGDALKEAGGVDIILFNACLMGSLEAAFEVRNQADMWVASENIMRGYICWQETVRNMGDYLKSGNYTNYRDFGEFLVNDIYENYLPYQEEDPSLTMSAIDLNKLGNMVDDFNNVCEVMITQKDIIEANFDELETEMEGYDFGNVGQGLNPGMRDYCDMLQSIREYCTEEQQIYFEKAEESFKEAVIANRYFSDYPDSQGLHLLFYRKLEFVEDSYSALGLDFLKKTKWDEFLEEFYGSPLKTGRERPISEKVYYFPGIENIKE